MQEGQKSILVIDDDITVRKLIEHHLKKNGFSTLVANGSQEGFKYLGENKIDLVLCDVTMQGMDGFTFCKQVRTDEKFKTLPFVFVTAKSTIEDKSTALEVGGDDIITKPFDVKELILKVRALLRKADIYKAYGGGPKKSVEESFQKTKSKILLVDDDETLSRLFKYNLEREGFECTAAPDALKGLELAKSIQPDIIISDIMMPEIDGFEFRKMLLKDENLKDIPFVFLTAKGEESDILEGYELGITDYVIKTAGPKVVVAKVSAIITSLGTERQKAVNELQQAAGSMHVKVVPDSSPKFEGFEISQWHQPFQGIPGGDFIDYFKLDDDNLAIILGDVMGKKWGAWYFAFAYASYVRSAVRVVLQDSKEKTPGSILQHVNQSVYQDAKVSEVFATLSVLVLNNKSKTVKYTGAGDLPVICCLASNGGIKKVKSNGTLLGFAANGNYDDISIEMKPGDCLFLVTDGIIETRNAEGEQFGARKLDEVIKNLSPDDDPLETIKKEFVNYTERKFEDDISLITIKCKD
ncbi:MAG: response regulator [Ignavibacteriaceae bacterium]|jgi:sigma-B regulation protein RsbU (phosphoserine phosphatase)